MSNLKTNTNRGDARERTKNLENITIMGEANQNLQTNQNTKTNILTFDNNTLSSANNHTNLLKATHGHYNLQPCCDLTKEKATTLEDGLLTNINVNSQTTLASSSCNRVPLYGENTCNTPQSNIILNVKKDNFNYPIPLKKMTCCDQTRTQPSIEINSIQNHTKYLPVMSKIKKYQYRTTDTTDPITYPNFNIVNKNNMVGYFKNNVYKTSSCSSSSTASTTGSSSTTGHKLKYSVQNTNNNCSCADYDDYKIQTATTTLPTTSSSTSYSSFFSRKWSGGC
jgi:hypothetical protein